MVKSAAGVGTQIAGYRVRSVIGQGGMGTVYLATQARLERDVALKIMAPDLAEDPVFRGRFLRESQIAASLEHPNVVPVFDAGEADGLLYIAMRHIAGRDLRALIRSHRGISPQLTLSIVRQLARGLDAAHARGLVHRDVKPSNVLLEEPAGEGEPPHAYITDFGLSKRVVESSGGTMGRPLGSVLYMSPEQIRGQRVDARSDVYSLGCLMYECLTGEVPFVRDSDVAVLYAHLEAERPLVSARTPELEPVLDEVIAWAMARSPAERPAGAGELADALGQALAGGSSWTAPRERPEIAQGVLEQVELHPIVGREREESELRLALERAIAGRSSVVLLGGEAGIGKTTLAHRLAAHAQHRGVRAVWGFGGSFGETPPPYWHWVQVTRALARADDGPALLERLGGSAARLLAIAPDIAPGVASSGSAPLAADDGPFHVYDALANLLRHASHHSGLLVVLDDLHVADEASLLALSFIAAAVRDAGVLIVGTYREGELTPSGEEPAHHGITALRELARNSIRISLSGLGSEQVAGMITARTGHSAPAQLIERVHAVTDGNPLFVTELLALLESEGRLADSELASSSLRMPSGVNDAISQRLTSLPPQGRDVLSVAAVIGARFRASTLARASGVSPRELLSLLDRASQLQLVRPERDLADGYSFSHGLVQGSLYESLTHSRRCELHGAVGEALEREFDVAAGEGLAEVAYHYIEAAPAGDTERALLYARRAADRAVETFAYDQAITLYTRALELVEGGVDRERTALLQSLGEAQMRAGDTEAARATLAHAAEAARAHEDPRALARAALACNIWGLTFGVDELLLRLAEESVQQLTGGDSPGLLACVQGLLATALYWTDDVERRYAMAAQALELARAQHARAGDAESAKRLAYVIGRYLIARWGPDSADLDLPVSQELIALAGELHDSELEILVRNWRVTVLLEVGAFTAVDQEIARIEQMAGELRQPRAMVFLPLHMASRAATMGRLEEAERLNAEAGEIGVRVHGTVGELAGAAQLIAIRLQQGRLSELEAPVAGIVNLHPTMVGMQCSRALIFAESGRRDQARAELERLTAAGLAGLPRDNIHIVALAVLGEVAAELGDVERARLVFEWLEPYAGRWVVAAGAGALWPVERSLGRLATVAGRADALAHIERAREQAARAGAAPSLALAALDEARLRATGDGEADRAATLELAARARSMAQEIGMGLVVDAATMLEANAF